MTSDASSFFATWGCLMLAYLFDAILYGAGMILIGQYFLSKGMGRDTTFTICTVAVLGILATVQIAFLSHQIFFDFVTNFGNNEALATIPFSASAMLLAICLIAFTAQMFYATRVWLISNRSILYTTPIVVLGFLQIVSGLVQAMLDIVDPKFAVLRHNTAKVHSIQSAAAASCDVSITAILCYLLYDARSGIRKTDTVIDKMIKYAINRGAATSFCALLNLIFFVALPKSFIFMVPLLPSGQLYVISVVSMLITREALREQISTPNETITSFALASIVRGIDNGNSTANMISDGAHNEGQKVVLAWH